MLRLASIVLVTACSAKPATSPDGGDARGDDAATIIDAPTSNVAPVLVTSFAGESGAAGTRNCGRSGGANCSYKDHPDASIASNGTYVVEVTGQSVTVYDAAGTQLAQTAAAMFVTAAGGSAPAPTGVNDPYVDWNEFAQRWVVSIPTDKQDFLIVSATADPRGAWSGAALTATNRGDITMKLAHDLNGEYIGEYPFDGHGVPDPNTASLSWYCFAIPTTEMTWSGGFTPAHTNQHDCAYEARPVMDHDAAKAPGAPFYFLGKTCAAGSCQNATNQAMGLIVHGGTWNGTSITFDSTGAGGADQIVSSGFLYNTPIDASQGGGAAVAATESHRVMGAEQRGTTLYGVVGSGPCTASCGAQGADTHDLAFYVAVDVANYPTLALAGGAKVTGTMLDVIYPALALDAAGNVAVTAMCTGPSQRMSVCAWAHGASDPPATLTGPVVLFAGTQAYNCNGGSQLGTGTYANAAFDGAALWAVEQDGESTASCNWTTRIAKLAIQ
jgi:hypothetical protein